MTATIVIAPDSFKGTLSAAAVADALAIGWRSIRPGDRVVLLPQADGGEGTLDAIESAVSGAVRHSVRTVRGPDGRATAGEWLELIGGTAVIELAQSSGLTLMGALDPLGATTRGMGEVIGAAITAGAQRLIIGLGGSASTDAGLGALAALGAKFLDNTGATISELGGGALHRVAAADLSGLLPAPPGGVIVLTDVTAPLTGPTGAARVFAPQKGASLAQVADLDAALAHVATVLGGDPDAPGAGAAGGTAYGFATLWGARIVPGARFIAELSGLTALPDVDLVLTGEGRLDEQSASGKVVGTLLDTCARVWVVAGQLASPTPHFALSLADLAGGVEAAMADPARWLTDAGARAAREFSQS